MKNIALFSHSPHFEGAENMLFQLGRLLQNDPDFEPIFFVPNFGENTPLEKILRAHRLRFVHIDPTPCYLIENITHAHAGEIDMREQISTVTQLFDDLDIALVVTNTLTRALSVFAALRSNLPVIAWSHGIIDPFLLAEEIDAPNGRFRFLMDTFILRVSQKTICCSRLIERIHAQRIDADRLKMIHNWVCKIPPLEPQTATDEPLFVCLNTFHSKKGVDMILLAAHQLNQEGYVFQIELYGDGPIKKELEAMKQTRALTNVRMMGRTLDTDSVYRRAVALLQPSYYESFGMTVIEAMAYAKPVIATRSGGPEEIIEDGTDGFLVEPGNAAALAERMKWILEHPENAQNMGIAAREKVIRDFSETRAKDQVLPLINDVLQNFSGYDKTQRLLENMMDFLYLDVVRDFARNIKIEIQRYARTEQILKIEIQRYARTEQILQAEFSNDDAAKAFWQAAIQQNRKLSGLLPRLSRPIDCASYFEFPFDAPGHASVLTLYARAHEKLPIYFEFVQNGNIVHSLTISAPDSGTIDLTLPPLKGKMRLRIRPLKQNRWIRVLECEKTGFRHALLLAYRFEE